MGKTMATTRGKVWFNPIKRTFKIELEDNIELKITQQEVYANGILIATGNVARQLYNSLLMHNNIAVKQSLSQLLPVVQILLS